MNPTETEVDWVTELAELLAMLSAAQDELLGLLAEKRRLLVAADRDGLMAIATREEELIGRLQACQERRSRLLALSEREGRPATDIRTLAARAPASHRRALEEQVDWAAHRARLLQHQSLTNWLLVQRTLIHLSGLLEIIATGGRLQPTYGKGEPTCASGSLVDQAV